jgi:hypothetical protein
VEKNLVRAAGLSKKGGAKPVLKLADLAFKLGVSLTPGANALYEAIKIGAEPFRDYLWARNEKRFNEYCRTLLTGEGVVDQDMMHAELHAADFHALLDSCLSDIEEEKTTPYANLTRSIARQLVPVTYRRHFIHSLKELAFGHLEILRETYIATRYSCIGQNDKLIHPRDFLTHVQTDTISQLALEALIGRGLITKTEITALGVTFIESCYSEDDLEPYNFNYKASNKTRGVIIKLTDNKEIKLIEASLTHELKRRQIQTETAGVILFDGGQSDDPYVKFADFAFVLATRGRNFSQGVSDTLNSSLCGKKSVQIFVDDALGGGEQEPVMFMDAPSKIIGKKSPAQAATEAVELILSL